MTGGHLKIIKQLRNSEFLINSTDITIPKKNFTSNFSTTILEGKDWNIEKLALEANTSTWYTDGSKTNEGTGFGVNGPNVKKSVSLGYNATIFQAELVAIHDCIQTILSSNPKGGRYAILSDSQAAIKSLLNTESHSLLPYVLLAY